MSYIETAAVRDFKVSREFDKQSWNIRVLYTYILSEASNSRSSLIRKAITCIIPQSDRVRLPMRFRYFKEDDAVDLQPPFRHAGWMKRNGLI